MNGREVKGGEEEEMIAVVSIHIAQPLPESGTLSVGRRNHTILFSLS